MQPHLLLHPNIPFPSSHYPDKYLLALIDKYLNEIDLAKCFISLNLTYTYCQINIRETDK